MSDRILFIKEVYVLDSNGGRHHRYLLEKEEIATNPPMLNTQIIMPNGERFDVGHIVQDLKLDRYIVYDYIGFPCSIERNLEPAVKKHLKRGWKKRKKRP